MKLVNYCVTWFNPNLLTNFWHVTWFKPFQEPSCLPVLGKRQIRKYYVLWYLCCRGNTYYILFVLFYSKVDWFSSNLDSSHLRYARLCAKCLHMREALYKDPIMILWPRIHSPLKTTQHKYTQKDFGGSSLMMASFHFGGKLRSPPQHHWNGVHPAFYSGLSVASIWPPQDGKS